MEERLFESTERGERRTSVPAAEAPLAVRMRPRDLDEIVGQGHLLGEGSALRTAIESGHLHSAILYGPPGSGKTTLARIAANRTDAAFEEESAVNAGRLVLLVVTLTLVVPEIVVAKAWQRITSKFSNYRGYEKKTDREIPVLRITPASPR